MSPRTRPPPLLCVAAIGLMAVLAGGCRASAVTDVAALAGTWRGRSLCAVKPSPCHDETVVYRIARAAAPKTVSITMNKIVDGKELVMGKADCHLDGARSLVCPFPRGAFRFDVDGRVMRGTVALPDGTVFRRIEVRRND